MSRTHDGLKQRQHKCLEDSRGSQNDAAAIGLPCLQTDANRECKVIQHRHMTHYIHTSATSLPPSTSLIQQFLSLPVTKQSPLTLYRMVMPIGHHF